MNAIEERLWDYIDGCCPAEDKQTISLLIEQDAHYRAVYLQLLTLNDEFTALELEVTPNTLTFKVMETVRAENAHAPLKAAVNPYIVKGITGFYVSVILALVVLLLGHTDWSAGPGNLPAPVFKIPDVSYYFKGTVLRAFLFFDMIVGLFLLDTCLRAKKLPKFF